MANGATKLPITKSSEPNNVAERKSLGSLRRDIDRLFEDFHPFDWRLPSRILGFELPRIARDEWQVLPAMDLVEKEDAYELTAELPGLDEKNVEITLSNHTLTIKGEKHDETEEKQKGHYLSERRYGAFQRNFRLPDGVDADNVDAAFAKGVLTVRLPKTAEAKKAEKTIAIKAA